MESAALTRSQSSLRSLVRGGNSSGRLSRTSSLSNHHQRIRRQVLKSDATSKLQKVFAHVLYSTAGDAAIAVVAIINFCTIILNADQHAAGQTDSPWLNIVNWTCFSMYSLELTMRAYVERCRLFRRTWNWIDILVVVIGLVEAVYASISDPRGNENVRQAISAFRVSRLLRLFKVYALVSLSQDLRKLIHGIMGCLRTLMFSFVLVCAFMTTWAVVAVEFIGPVMGRVAETTHSWETCDRCERSFRSVMGANLTFFQTIVAGDSWGQVAIPVMELFPYTAFIFVGALFSVVFGILNLIIAVLVDTAAEVRSKDTEVKVKDAENSEKKERKALEKIFRQIDVDESGTLSFAELIAGAQNVPEFKHKLRALDISTQEIEQLFILCDEDGSGEIDVTEFVETLQRITAGDSKTASMLVKHYVVHMQKNQEILAEKMEEVEDKLLSLPNSLSKEVMQQLRTLQLAERATGEASGGSGSGGAVATTRRTGFWPSASSPLQAARNSMRDMVARVLWRSPSEMSAYTDKSDGVASQSVHSSMSAHQPSSPPSTDEQAVPHIGPRGGAMHKALAPLSPKLLPVEDPWDLGVLRPPRPCTPRDTGGVSSPHRQVKPAAGGQVKRVHLPNTRKHDKELDTIEGLRRALDQRFVAERMADTVLAAQESLDKALKESLESLTAEWKASLAVVCSAQTPRIRTQSSDSEAGDRMSSSPKQQGLQRADSTSSGRTERSMSAPTPKTPRGVRRKDSDGSVRCRTPRAGPNLDGVLTTMRETLLTRVGSVLEEEFGSLHDLQKDMLQALLAGVDNGGPRQPRRNKYHVFMLRNSDAAE